MTEQTEQNKTFSDDRYATFQSIYEICAIGDKSVLKTDEAVAFLETARHESLRIVWMDFLQPLRDNGYSLFDVLTSLSWALPDVFGEEGNVSAGAIEKEADLVWTKKLRLEGKLPPEDA